MSSHITWTTVSWLSLTVPQFVAAEHRLLLDHSSLGSPLVGLFMFLQLLAQQPPHGCLNLCEPTDRASRARAKRKSHLDDLSHYHHLLSDFTYQQPNLPSTCQRSSPLPPTPGNYSPYSLLTPSQLTLKITDLYAFFHCPLKPCNMPSPTNYPPTFRKWPRWPSSVRFRTGHSTETALLMMTEPLSAARV